MEVPKPTRQTGADENGNSTIWLFQSPLRSEEIAERLTRDLGRMDEPFSKPVMGKVGLAEARLYRRPTDRRGTPTPLRIKWTPNDRGSQVKCRMPPLRDQRLFMTVWRIFGAVVLLLGVLDLFNVVPGAFRHGRDGSWFKLASMLFFAVVAWRLPDIARWGIAQERAFLIDYLTDLLDAGPVRELRE